MTDDISLSPLMAAYRTLQRAMAAYDEAEATLPAVPSAEDEARLHVLMEQIRTTGNHLFELMPARASASPPNDRPSP